MVGSARIVGGLVFVGAALFGCGAFVWLWAAHAEGALGTSGFALGALLALVVLIPVAGMGVFLVAKGRAEESQHVEAEQTRRLLNMVLTQGRVRMGDAVVELGLPQEEVRAILYDAVGRGLFSGYINWDEGVLYAKEAAHGRQPCPNCGGTIDIAGRGVFQCPYCGTEMFLARGDEREHAIQGVTPPAGGGAGTGEPPGADG